MIQINVGNKAFYSLLIVLGVLIFGVGVYASHGGSQQGVHNPGHAFECVSGIHRPESANPVQPVTEIYEPSTLGIGYDFGEVFIESVEPGDNSPILKCNDINGWVMTGCASSTQGGSLDNDEFMDDGNRCRGDSSPEPNWISARCCRVVG